MSDEARYKRKLSDLSLIDDHLFGLFIQEAGSGKKRSVTQLIPRLNPMPSEHYAGNLRPTLSAFALLFRLCVAFAVNRL